MEAPLTKVKGREVDIYNIVKDAFVKQEVIFFGGFANTLYSKYMPPKMKKKLLNGKLKDFLH